MALGEPAAWRMMKVDLAARGCTSLTRPPTAGRGPHRQTAATRREPSGAFACRMTCAAHRGDQSGDERALLRRAATAVLWQPSGPPAASEQLGA